MDEQKEVIICEHCKKPILNKDELVVLYPGSSGKILCFKHNACLPYSKIFKRRIPYPENEILGLLHQPGMPAINSKLFIPTISILLIVVGSIMITLSRSIFIVLPIIMVAAYCFHPRVYYYFKYERHFKNGKFFLQENR